MREEVLKKWEGLKKKWLNLNEEINFLESKVDSVLPSFPTGIDSVRRKLDFWTSVDYRLKLDKNKDEVMQKEIKDERLMTSWQMFHYNSISMFKELTQGWKEDIDN